MMGASWERIWLIFVIELLFGVLFAMLVWTLGKRKEGYVALFVVAGVGFTLAGLWAINWQAGAAATLLFVASGTPMVIADIARYINLREQENHLNRNDQA